MSLSENSSLCTMLIPEHMNCTEQCLKHVMKAFELLQQELFNQSIYENYAV